MKKEFRDSDFFMRVAVFLVIAILLALAVLIGVMIYQVITIDEKINSRNADNFTLFITQMTIFIALITLSFAITIAVPHFITKSTIKSQIIKTAKKVIQGDFKEDLVSNMERATQIDSHLSRMIAFSLLENDYYYWTIGCARTSLCELKTKFAFLFSNT